MDDRFSPSSSLTSDHVLSSTETTKPIVTKTKSNKRKTMLVIDGYHFQLKSLNVKKTIKFWRCSNRTCDVLLHTSVDDEFVRYSGKTSEHTHLPKPADSGKRNLRERMRIRAENEILPLQQIAEDEVRKGLLSGEALAVLRAVNNIGMLSQFGSVSTQKIPEIPPSSSFSIPDLYTRDYRNHERLLLHDSSDPTYMMGQSQHMRSAGRVLIWSSDVQLNLLFDSQRLHMDGPFSTSPSMFDQVFIIQAFLHETCIPVVYALLPDRKTITYIHLFNVLFVETQRLNKTFQPSLIMTDFDPGLAKAISLEFTGNTIQKGYFFHFCQSVYRRVQSLGLSSIYLEDIMVRSLIRQMMALALVPEQYVQSLFLDLGQTLNNNEHEALDNLYKYFGDQWMRQIKMWNVYEVPDKTNNYSEGYNHRFERRVHTNHPNVWAFINFVRKEVDTVHDIIIQINSGMQSRTKRFKSRTAEKRMKELYHRFDNQQISIDDLLRELSFFVAHEK